MIKSVHNLQSISSMHRNPIDAVEYALDFLERATQEPRVTKVKPGSLRWLEMHRDMPYAVHRTASEGTGILVNRDYKPLGWTSPDWAVYEDCKNLLVPLNDAIRAIPGTTSRVSVWLFDDLAAPWFGKASMVAYMKRVRKLRDCLKAHRSSI